MKTMKEFLLERKSKDSDKDGLPDKYEKGLSDKEEKKLKKEIQKRKKMSDDDPDSYKPFSTDKGKETKPSKHTKKYKDKYVNESKEAVKTKAEETGLPYDILKQVYDRGMAAWKGYHRPGTTPQQWALARINSFSSGGKTITTGDKDLFNKLSKSQKEKIKS